MANTSEKYSNLDKKIEKYFAECDAKNCEKIIKPYTLSGLLCHLKITRAQFEKMSKSRKYALVLCTAKARIEAFIEENSLTGGLSANASANSLKYNFGWGEKLSISSDEQTKSVIISLDDTARKYAR